MINVFEFISGASLFVLLAVLAIIGIRRRQKNKEERVIAHMESNETLWPVYTAEILYVTPLNESEASVDFEIVLENGKRKQFKDTFGLTELLLVKHFSIAYDEASNNFQYMDDPELLALEEQEVIHVPAKILHKELQGDLVELVIEIGAYHALRTKLLVPEVPEDEYTVGELLEVEIHTQVPLEHPVIISREH